MSFAKHPLAGHPLFAHLGLAAKAYYAQAARVSLHVPFAPDPVPFERLPLEAQEAWLQQLVTLHLVEAPLTPPTRNE